MLGQDQRQFHQGTMEMMGVLVVGLVILHRSCAREVVVMVVDLWKGWQPELDSMLQCLTQKLSGPPTCSTLQFGLLSGRLILLASVQPHCSILQFSFPTPWYVVRNLW